MKRIVILCSVLVLQGLNSFGQTNAVPPTGQPVARPEGQKAVSKPKTAKTAGATAVPSQGIVTRGTEAQSADLATIRRVQREGLLTPRATKTNYEAALEGIFRPVNDQMGETCIRDTVVTIFPTGR
jgi:hypothetical protein